MSQRTPGFNTLAVHAGAQPDPTTGAITTPIYQTSTFVQKGVDALGAYEYGRTHNPTRQVLERNVASLEGGQHGFAFGSGLAALDAVLKLLKAGDHVRFTRAEEHLEAGRITAAQFTRGEGRLYIRVFPHKSVTSIPAETRMAAVRALGTIGHPNAQNAIVGAFAFRIAAILLAVWLKDIQFVMLLGAAYLLWLPYHHFVGHGDTAARRLPRAPTSWLGMSPFWSTVVKVELTDIVFAIDSILVAVALSNKLWVIITGGILGVIAMRLVIGQLLVLVNRYPALVDGAFVIIAWVGIKLLLEYGHQIGYLHFAIPKWLSLGLIVVIFAIAFFYARKHPHVEVDEEAAAKKVDQLENDLMP